MCETAEVKWTIEAQTVTYPNKYIMHLKPEYLKDRAAV